MASETISYSYDTSGRLVKVSRSGTVNNGVRACYSYDKADNRSNVTVDLTADCSAGAGVTFSISSNGPVTEGVASGFTITKSGTATGSLQVSYSTANGSAVAPGDYTAVPLTAVTFLAGETAKSISVTTNDDTTVESAETFTMTLSSPSGGASIGIGTATATLNDNDGTASFAISNAYGMEGGTLYFTVTKTGSVAANVTYATANGTATSTSDYVAVSGTLSFAANETSKTIAVSTRNDSTLEATEYFYVNLTGATTTDSQGVGTIDDDDEGGGCPPEGCPLSGS